MGFLLGIGKWFVTNKYGLAILLGVAVIATVAITHHVVYKNGFEAGALKEKTKAMAEMAIANQRQAAENLRRNAVASEIAKVAFAAGQLAVSKTDLNTNQTKEVIRYVYHDRPSNKPVAPGACVHPVDSRVQDRINKAVDLANGK